MQNWNTGVQFTAQCKVKAAESELAKLTLSPPAKTEMSPHSLHCATTLPNQSVSEESARPAYRTVQFEVNAPSNLHKVQTQIPNLRSTLASFSISSDRIRERNRTRDCTTWISERTATMKENVVREKLGTVLADYWSRLDLSTKRMIEEIREKYTRNIIESSARDAIGRQRHRDRLQWAILMAFPAPQRITVLREIAARCKQQPPTIIATNNVTSLTRQ